MSLASSPASFPPSPSPPSPPPPQPTGGLVTGLVTMVTYGMLHIILDQVVIPAWMGRVRYRTQVSRRDRIDTAEKVCSSINAMVVSGFAYRTIYSQQAYHGDLLHTYPLSAHHTFAHLCGYTVYDLMTMWYRGGEHWSMWIHHIMSAYGTALIMYLRNPSYFPLLYCTSELTAVANNAVWYMQRYRPEWRHRLVLALVVRAVVFTVARVWIGPYAMYRMGTHAQWRVSTWVHQWFHDPTIHPVAAVLTLINVGTIGWFNVGWTKAVWKVAIRGIRRGRVGLPPLPRKPGT